MDPNTIKRILTVNAGSSSIKLAVFTSIGQKLAEGKIEKIGQPLARFVKKDTSGTNDLSQSINAPDHLAANSILIDWLKQQALNVNITSIGHRIVHGGPKYYQPCLIDDTALTDLRSLSIFDPEHLTIEIKLIEEFQKLYPSVKQVACFDTAFHHDLPTVARLLPIPRRYEAEGIRRYGFHGLSCEFVIQELKRLDGPEAANSKLVIAHLGNGVSLTAVEQGKSIDTTMGLTPASGVPMSTRSGDLDPGLALYLARNHSLDANQFNDLVNSQSGLLGMSETTSDMEQLLQLEVEDNRAKDTVDLFCYQVKKSIGSLSASMGGLDRLIFTGGMGENSPKIRARICDGLDFLGVKIEESRNTNNADVISPDNSRVAVRVVRTDESVIIAQNVIQVTAVT